MSTLYVKRVKRIMYFTGVIRYLRYFRVAKLQYIVYYSIVILFLLFRPSKLEFANISVPGRRRANLTAFLTSYIYIEQYSYLATLFRQLKVAKSVFVF